MSQTVDITNSRDITMYMNATHNRDASTEPKMKRFMVVMEFDGHTGPYFKHVEITSKSAAGAARQARHIFSPPRIVAVAEVVAVVHG